MNSTVIQPSFDAATPATDGGRAQPMNQTGNPTGEPSRSTTVRGRTSPVPGRDTLWWLIPIGGAIVWVIWAFAYARTIGWWDWPSIALMFSPLVIVPLGLSVVARPETGPVVPTLTVLRRLVPVAAVAVAVSFLMEPGWRAAALTIPWLALTGALALVAVLRTLSRRGVEPGMGTDASLVFVAMGSIWVTTSRLGANPLGYDDLLVLLTAVHLHYAGFVLPLAAGTAAIRRDAGAIVPAAAVVGVPATGIGVALGGNAEWLAATWIGLAGVATAVLLFQIALGRSVKGELGDGTVGHGTARTRWARMMVGIGGAALASAMALGIGWAWTQRFGWAYFDILQMARIHGMLNAFGFALIGLIGLNLLPALPTPQRRVVARLRIASAEDLEAMALSAGDDVPTCGANTTKCTSTASVHLPYGFDAGRRAILAWAGHDAAGIRRWPERPEIAIGTTLALSTPVGPAAIAATLQITEVIDEPDRFGFTYAALPDHPETGQQTMVVERTEAGGARAVVTTSCGPWLVLARMMPSITQHLQDRIREQYLNGIATWPIAGDGADDDHTATSGVHSDATS